MFSPSRGETAASDGAEDNEGFLWNSGKQECGEHLLATVQLQGFLVHTPTTRSIKHIAAAASIGRVIYRLTACVTKKGLE